MHYAKVKPMAVSAASKNIALHNDRFGVSSAETKKAWTGVHALE
jgi:hypothetical protein